MILRTLKERAEAALGQPVARAVVTVPAFFNDRQREATREAGLLAGLDIARIINEPTAAALTYQPRVETSERLLIYDLGGGTFDVSIVQIEQGVVEVLASHGDTHLGGDDFDQLLLDFVCGKFEEEHGFDPRREGKNAAASRSRLLQAVEAAKIALSDEACVTIAEEFIAEKEGRPLSLMRDIHRHEYEELIEPLLAKTLTCVDASLEDAGLTADQIDRVILVGGSTRTPRVHDLLRKQLGHEPRREVDPDLCVSLGAAVQGGLIDGLDVGPVLVDIASHTLGIACLGELHGRTTRNFFSPVIPRNTPLPASRSELYGTSFDGQDKAKIEIYQGENEDARFNDSVGDFMLEGLDAKANRGNEILVRFQLNLDGILKVSAIERDTGVERAITIDNALSKFQKDDRSEAQSRLETFFGSQEGAPTQPAGEGNEPATRLIAQARQLIPQAADEDAAEMRDLIAQLDQALQAGDDEAIQDVMEQLEDVVFYLEDA